MARNKIERPIHPAPLLNEEVVRQDMAAMDTLTVLKNAYPEDRDLVNQLLGQAQMADSLSKFCRTVRLSKLAFVRENKLYRALEGKQMPDGPALKGTWEEFCGMLGRSKDQVDTDIQNLQAFGEEALESMTRMGIGYRELRQYRRLPADDRLALIEAAKAGDKAELVDVAEMMISKHLKESEALTQERDEARKTADAREQVIASKEKVISRLQEQLVPTTPEFPGKEALLDLERQSLLAAGEITVGLLRRVQTVRETNAPGPIIEQAIAAALGRVLAAARHLADDLDIAITGPLAAPEARDGIAEGDAIWDLVNAEIAAKAANHGQEH